MPLSSENTAWRESPRTAPGTLPTPAVGRTLETFERPTTATQVALRGALLRPAAVGARALSSGNEKVF